VKQLEAIAAEKSVQASQLALAWVLAQGDDLVPFLAPKEISGGKYRGRGYSIEASGPCPNRWSGAEGGGQGAAISGAGRH